MKKIILSWLFAFVLVFGLNGVFHSLAAASFFDSNLEHLSPVFKKMHDSNPVPVAILDFLLTGGMVLLITQGVKEKVNTGIAMRTGAAINLLTASAWNLANTSMAEWPLKVTLADVSWHALLGCAGGFLIAKVWNWKK